MGELQLVNAREPGPAMARVTAAELDIDQGMVLIVGNEMYYGSDAIHKLSMLSTRSGFFNRLTYYLFQSKRRSIVLYPLLCACRNLLLKIPGRTKINKLDQPDNNQF